jgi:flagellar basal body rod protein FlgC
LIQLRGQPDRWEIFRRRNAVLAEEFDPSQHSTSKEDTMAVQIVMDQSGDTRQQFDPADVRAVALAEAALRS